MEGKKDGEVVTFEFPIIDLGRVAPTKSIRPHVLPNFRSLEMKTMVYFYFNLNYFVGPMVIVLMIKSWMCFPLLSKEQPSDGSWASMGIVQTWEDMKHVFLKRYQDYCKVNEDIFEMTQG